MTLNKKIVCTAYPNCNLIQFTSCVFVWRSCDFFLIFCSSLFLCDLLVFLNCPRCGWPFKLKQTTESGVVAVAVVVSFLFVTYCPSCDFNPKKLNIIKVARIIKYEKALTWLSFSRCVSPAELRYGLTPISSGCGWMKTIRCYTQRKRLTPSFIHLFVFRFENCWPYFMSAMSTCACVRSLRPSACVMWTEHTEQYVGQYVCLDRRSHSIVFFSSFLSVFSL